MLMFNGVVQVRLVAVSKTKPVEALREAYEAGQRVFGENYVQEMLDKAPAMPSDVRWHFIGHLQSNKVKAIVGECWLRPAAAAGAPYKPVDDAPAFADAPRRDRLQPCDGGDGGLYEGERCGLRLP
jgi:hypothetical protein